MRTTLAGAGMLALLLSSACDPCGMTLGCAAEPTAALSGQIVDEDTGLPVAGARVDLVRTGGVETHGTSVGTVTHEDGTFELALSTVSAGSIIASVRVQPPNRPDYTVPNVPVGVTTTAGDAAVLPPWSSARPNFPYVFEFYLNGTADQRVTNARVEFVRTGGVALFGPGGSVDTVRGTTSDAGWSYLLIATRTPVAGDVVGDLTIEIPVAPYRSAVRGVTLRAVPAFHPPVGLVRLGVGP